MNIIDMQFQAWVSFPTHGVEKESLRRRPGDKIQSVYREMRLHSGGDPEQKSLRKLVRIQAGQEVRIRVQESKN
jgi:hypothetical protein